MDMDVESWIAKISVIRHRFDVESIKGQCLMLNIACWLSVSRLNCVLLAYLAGLEVGKQKLYRKVHGRRLKARAIPERDMRE